uniref:E3 ubiquitin-protein ligase RNF25 n=1 Tax=Cyclopterus lumpus TaxID=8103 RepID=A0A8C2WHD2_CYCLU
ERCNWEVSLVLYPSTAEDSVSQFVRLTLTLTLDQQYPSSSPDISIHNPRGLSDDKISSVQRCLQLEAQSCLGSPVLYQLIEKAKEILTESNIPHGNCVICLYGFKEGETFSKTSCYHYFHSHCLGRYASHSERELLQREKELEEDKTRERELTVVCPVCREPLTYDVDQLLRCPAPQLPEVTPSSHCRGVPPPPPNWSFALRLLCSSPSWTEQPSAPLFNTSGVNSRSSWRDRSLEAGSSTRRRSPNASSSTPTR